MIGRRGFLGAAVSGGLTGFRGHAIGQDAPVNQRKALKPVRPARPVSKEVEPDPRVNRLLEDVRETNQVPGLIGGFVNGETLSAVGAVGVRKVGNPTRIKVDDQVHLGSCTKAMTATLLGMLVDEGKLTWQSTVLEVFPERAKSLHADFQTVTLSQLLRHRAGLPHDGPWWILGRGKSTTEQRRILLSGMMKSAPRSKPGSTFEYSNVGYAIAGLMAEQVTGMSWEMLMRTRLFEPLEMTTAGFGIPGKPGTLVQPWGHREVSGGIEAVQQDNAPSLGPAGTVHVSLPDWGKFAALHLQAARGKPRLLKSETFHALHTPSPGEEYAGGWAIGQRSWTGGPALNHSGSNLTWYATVWIAPERNVAILTATNQGGASAAKACQEAVSVLITFALPTRRQRGR